MANAAEYDDNDDDGPIVVQHVDQFPHVILRGSVANLAALRGCDMAVRDVFFRERATGGEEDENLLLGPSSSIQATIKMGRDSIEGEVFVTRTQVLFVAKDQDQAEHDIAIGASCIVLHAMMEEPQMAVYLQISDENSDNAQQAVMFGNPDDTEEDYGENDNGVEGGSGPLEATIEPVEQEDCQRLFDSLCKLVALHPMQDDEDDEGFMGGGGGGMFGGGDDLIFAPAAAAGASTVSSDDGSEGATETERDAMLERLDNLLVVRPEFEIQDGQFDDADAD